MAQKLEFYKTAQKEELMTNAPRVYNEFFNVHSYNVRPDGSVRLSSLCNYLQETAGNHAHKLDYDIQSLRRKNQTWVLYRLQLDIQRYPRWGDTVQIETWPSGGEGILAYRDFIISDQDMDLLGRGISQWMIVDLKKERPIRMPDEILELEVDKRKHMLAPRRDKMQYPENGNEEHSIRFKIRRNDLDVNGHVNNVSYISWINESIPKNVYENRRLNHLDIVFHNESRIGDEVISKASSKSDAPYSFIHRINRNKDSKPLSTAQSSWKHTADHGTYLN